MQLAWFSQCQGKGWFSFGWGGLFHILVYSAILWATLNTTVYNRSPGNLGDKPACQPAWSPAAGPSWWFVSPFRYSEYLVSMMFWRQKWRIPYWQKQLRIPLNQSSLTDFYTKGHARQSYCRQKQFTDTVPVCKSNREEVTSKVRISSINLAWIKQLSICRSINKCCVCRILRVNLETMAALNAQVSIVLKPQTFSCTGPRNHALTRRPYSVCVPGGGIATRKAPAPRHQSNVCRATMGGPVGNGSEYSFQISRRMVRHSTCVRHIRVYNFKGQGIVVRLYDYLQRSWY